MKLEGKVAIVTGGARGIGRQYCRGLAAEGARIVVADILEDQGKEAATEVGGLAVKVDISNEASVQAMVARALELTDRIDILVNNAAIVDVFPRKPFDTISVEEWDRVMAVNLRGTWLCCKALAPVFRRQGSGAIVNISSGTVLSGSPGIMHYVASKAAVIGITRCLARELGDYGVRVNAVTPGLTSSEVVVEAVGQEEIRQRAASRIFQREEQPQDLVGAVLFLCSDDSAFVTGQIINVDGGANFH
ncbi:MAG TPA: 3-oxoacyl-ACP reductase family protein [Chloroflexota bacterium]